MRACTQGGWAHRQRVSTTFLTQSFSCFPDGGLNLISLDLESDALPTDPPLDCPFKTSVSVPCACLSKFEVNATLIQVAIGNSTTHGYIYR